MCSCRQVLRLDDLIPVAVSSLDVTRLRWRYGLLVLALALPALASMFWLAQRQYGSYRHIALREFAIATEQRSVALDRLLRPVRDDVLRLRSLAQDLLGRELPVGGLRSEFLRAPPQAEPGRSQLSLDDLPALLKESGAQLLFSGAEPAPLARQQEGLSRAAAFGEQAQQMSLANGLMSRAYFVSAGADQAWLYPWQPSAGLLQDAGARTLSGYLQDMVRRAGMADRNLTQADAFEPSWSAPWRDARGQHFVTLRAALWRDVSLLGVVAIDVPLAPLQQALAGQAHADGRPLGSFWLVDGHGEVLASAGDAAAANPPRLQPQPGELAQAVGTQALVQRGLQVAPWQLLAQLPLTVVQASVLQMFWPQLLVAAEFVLMFVLVLYLLWRGFTAPALQLVDYLRRAADSAQAVPPPAAKLWAPWFRLVGDTFAQWRAAALQVEHAEALKSAVVDHALSAIITTDARGVIVEFNPAAEAMFQRSRAAALGQVAPELITPQRHRGPHQTSIQRMLSGSMSSILGKRVELTAMRADGSEFPTEMVLWRTRVGAHTFFTASMVDMTERHAAEQQILRQREALRQSEKLSAMGGLLAGVAHELNNPLAILIGRASLLESKAAHSEGLQADARRIREAAERCAGIVRSFLSMARQRSSQREPVQLNDLVGGAVDLLQYGLRGSGIKVELRLAAELPSVLADADQIGQIVLNLLVNAQQALASLAGLSEQDEPRRLRIETGLEPARADRSPRAWLRVADNGPGVAPALRERIFDPFFTTRIASAMDADTAAPAAGTGQGLAFSRSVALEHGGSLQLETLAPAGLATSFRVSLPLAPWQAAAPPGADSLPMPLAPITPEAARILVVDDEAELADVIREMLESAGFEVATAESGAVALELLAEARFDAIVSDLRMPGMDGPALWRAVRQQHPQLARRMVFVTGDTLSAGAERFLADTRCPCVDKPFSKAELLGKLRPLVAGA